MFDQFVGSSSKRGNKRWIYFVSTATVWMMALATTIVAGIFAYDARLGEQYEVTVLTGPPPPGPPSKLNAKQPETGKKQPKAEYVAVEKSPAEIASPPSRPPDLTRIMPAGGGSQNYGSEKGGGGTIDGVVGGRFDTDNNEATAPPPPRPPEEKKEEQPAPVKTLLRKPSTILQGSAITQVKPPYPALARAIKLTGQVVVEVTIDEEGNCISARALSGHALLRDVSVAAARGWKWRPTLLNDVPVKVIGTITFNFQL